MKQHTTQEQTDKLNQLGYGNLSDYSVGVLIELLPKSISNINGRNYLNIFTARNYWFVIYQNHSTYYELSRASDRELIDALYKMAVKLKDN